MTARSRVALSLLLIVALLLPPSGLPTGGTVSAVDDSYILTEKALPLNRRIDPAVTEAFNREEYVEVLVKLTTQVDTGKVAGAAQIHTPSKQRRLRIRATVVEKLRDHANKSQSDLLKYLKKEQGRGNVLEYQSFYIVNIIFVKASRPAVEQLARHPDVKVILPNIKIYLDQPEIVEIGGEFTPLAAEWNISRINAPHVWDLLDINGSGTVVGIMDTGVYWEHEALKTRFRGYNPEDPGNPNVLSNWFDATSPGSSLPKDLHGHGTHVTGTVLGSAGSNRIGVAPGALWIAARIFGDDNSATPQGILSAGQFMIAPPNAEGKADPDLAPDIINNSWGSITPGQVNEWFRPMVQSWRSAQILPVFAAGNAGQHGAGSISNPANYPESLAVAATDSNNNLASFSSRGPGYMDGIKPEISAPGVNIRSSIPGGGYQGGWNGTSMAAPHMAGTAALMLSANPHLTVDEVEQYLIYTAVPLTDQSYPQSPNHGYGYGLVDAYAAVSMVSRGMLTGQVLAWGIDLELPVIAHRQVYFSTYWEYGFPLEASVSDNMAVSQVKALVSVTGSGSWSEVPLYRYSGDIRNGDYWGQVPWPLVQGPSLDYKIVALDMAGNRAETTAYRVSVEFGLQTGWSEDFAEEPLHWYRDGDWEWGVPSGLVSQHGGKVMATNLTGNYSNNSESYLWMPPLDLRNAASPYLRIDHCFQIEKEYDAAIIGITADYGESWDIYLLDGDSEGWRSHYLDLNPYTNSENQVYVVFVFVSDENVTLPGWYIDRISVVDIPHNILYFSDFEDNNGQFTIVTWPLRNNSWGWGTPTSGPGMAFSGLKVWATVPGDNYYNRSHSAIRGPTVTLNSEGGNYLSFQHWFNLENNNAFGWVVFFVNDSDFFYFPDLYYTGSKTFWNLEIYPLDWLLLEGYEQFRPGFLFQSGFSWTRPPGWYLDDVKVYSVDFSLLSAGTGMAPSRPSLASWPSKLEPHISEMSTLRSLEVLNPAPDLRKFNPKIFRQPIQGPEPLMQIHQNVSVYHLLPASAVLTVVETGESTVTGMDGTYRLFHQETDGETLTLRVSAEGYKTSEQTFTLHRGQMLVLNFFLGPMDYLTGDVNDDGNIDIGDAILVLRHIVNLTELTDKERLAADVNLNGQVEISDADLIMRNIAGLANFPAPPW